ncbi:MAG: mechanosensitive ion channel [Flavobacteriia bacterium]|nr:mechanosensitive ion channel [Flavobacteriia bacterium]
MRVTQWAHDWLAEQGFTDLWINILTLAIDIIAILIISFIADYIARRILLSVAQRLVLKTKATWDDYLLEHKVFRNLAHLVPAVIVLLSIPLIFRDHEEVVGPLVKAAKIYITILAAAGLNRLFRALMKYVEEEASFKGKPYKTILQVLQVLNVFAAVMVGVSVLTGTKLGAILGAFAGATAILILIFQDTINGLLANFQITMYDLVEKGDWITFERYGVDGDVVSIDLTTVKVRNWDNTISSIPAKAFVSDSFVNWRGMKNANMRRIKRNILIDINSIALCDEEMLERFGKIKFVKEYVESRQTEIDKYNDEHGFDKGAASINGRHQTNIGIYRAYIKNYLANHPKVSKKEDATMMVRQLQPTAQGVPLEVYCFSADIVWENYEAIQSDIFDHLYAATEFFGLRLYQQVSGRDVHDSLSAGKSK